MKKSTKRNIRNAGVIAGRGVAAAGFLTLIAAAAYADAAVAADTARDLADALQRDFAAARDGDVFEVIGTHGAGVAVCGYGRIESTTWSVVVAGTHVGDVREYRIVRYGRTIRTVN